MIANSIFTDMIDDIFNTNVSEMVRSHLHTSSPAANILKKEGYYHIQLAAPGLEKSDFGLNVKEGRLIIKVEKEDNNDSHLTREWNYNNWSRSFRLSDDIDLQRIDASYDAGVLSIKLMKKEDDDSPSSFDIEIQ